MKNAYNLKIIALSLCFSASAPAWAGIGSLQVNSALGEPFSGSVVVTGDEARAALKGRPTISGAPLQVRVTPQGQNAVIHLRSSKPISDPMMSFSLVSGSQGRQYTALLDPPENGHGSSASARNGSKHHKQAHSVRNKSAARATAALQNRLASDNAVVKYNVDNNETLMDVARKVRPQNMTVEQTMHALLVANPQAFRNGNPDLMYRNISLNIPSTTQLYKLSKVKIKTVQQPVTAQSKSPVSVAPDAKAAENTAAATPTKSDLSANKIQKAAASEPIAPTKPEVAKTQDAGKTEAVAASASAPAASAASVVKAKPVQPKVNPTPAPVQPVEPTPEESLLPSWWPYALVGLAGVLLIAAFIWQRRKKRDAEEAEEYYSSDDEDDDDVVFNDEPPKLQQSEPASPAATNQASTAVAASSASADADDWSWLNDESSDSSEKADAPADNVSESAVTTQLPESKPEAAANKPEEDDIDWLNFNFTDDTPAAPADTTAPSVAEMDNGDDLSWLDQIDETEQPEVLTSKESPVTEPEKEEADSADFEWVVADDASKDEHESAAHSDVVMAEQTATDTDDLPSLDMNFSPEEEPAVVEPESKPAAAEVDTLNALADLQWDEDFKFDEESKNESAAVAEDTSSTIDQALSSQDQHAFVAEDEAISNDIDWDALSISDEHEDSQAAPSTSAQPTDADVVDVSSMDFTLDDNQAESTATESSAAPSPAPISSFATGNGAQDWLEQSAEEEEETDKPLTPEQQAIPLQAKLELAKMYLEMDDAVTARQTLRELVDEANGAVLAEAQNLLQQLGG
ncbi:FimV/HubP family polar landmark protein [Snodgrassella sp. B3837]|uniref:FimV/HubP family polar landmark protein n=1 Tax=Snodgrassella sp. B3837 TaxID=2818040 RepID=UPI00226A82B1|nr:FimV/HubP family polar landmark protein [Snodgrassella sp. B3837]MCX8753460.1 hypothetical protein [Snodgrassella sp. B3837]